MKVFVVYCHPSDDSFTRHVRDSFLKGVADAGHEYELSDLYRMDFRTDMSEDEYLRDSNYNTSPQLAADVLGEQAKINSADAIAFIYPVFWTEAPAKLVGWFDRVWSYGFAYGNKTMKMLDQALFMCTTGHDFVTLEQFGFLQSMKNVMLGDRLVKRVRKSDFVVFDGMSKEKKSRQDNWEKYLETAYIKGRTLFEKAKDDFSLDGRNFVAVKNSDAGEVSEQTVFCYHQKDNAVWAEYSGGSIVKGFLIGTMDDDHCLTFSYQHLNIHGELKTGSCHSQLRVENGKLRFYEEWQWASGETGTSIIEEL